MLHMSINIKQIRIINFLAVAVAFVLLAVFFIDFFKDPFVRQSPTIRGSYPGMVSATFFAIFALLISFKTKPQKGTLLYALFLALISQNFALQFLNTISIGMIPIWIEMMSFSLVCTVFIKSLQVFPRTLTQDNIRQVFKCKILNAYLHWSLRSYTWLAYPAIIFAAGFLSSFYQPVFNLTISFLNMAVIISGGLLLFVSYKKSTHAERNKILWLFWGVITYACLLIILLSIRLFNNEPGTIIRLIISSLMTGSITLSMFMSLFFSDTFDTGILIRRTIVDSTVFTLVIILYNTLEHYVLHWFSEVLHLSDVLISSILSGIFVMIFSPVHHRLMHYLEKRIKKRN